MGAVVVGGVALGAWWRRTRPRLGALWECTQPIEGWMPATNVDSNRLVVYEDRLVIDGLELPLREGERVGGGFVPRYKHGGLVAAEGTELRDIQVGYDATGQVARVEIASADCWLSWRAAGVPEEDGIPTRNRALISRLARWPDDERLLLMRAIREAADKDSGGDPPTHTSERTDLLPVLEAGLANDDHEVRTQAICALCYMKQPAAFPLIEKAFASQDSTVRYYACMGVEWLADAPGLRERAVAVLEAARDRKGEEKFDVRLHAAAGLEGIGIAQDPAIYVAALKDEKANESLAASALAKQGRRETIELMVQRLAVAKPSSDWHLSKALAKLTGQSLGRDAAKWREWLEAHRGELPEQVR